VGAADAEGRPAAFSTWGNHVDLLAPGTDIYSSFLRDGYAFSTGTSHASPFVAGAVALLKSHSRARGQALGDRRVKEILRATADRRDTRLKHPQAGYGALNMQDALRLLDHQISKKRATFGGYRHGQRLESRREQAV
jgi:subtilisin family serine protease